MAVSQPSTNTLLQNDSNTTTTTDTENTIKILLATDNHIGYLERDPVRGQDSVNTFEEILKLAVKHDVSFAFLSRFHICLWLDGRMPGWLDDDRSILYC